jgi:hypothetical protein
MWEVASVLILLAALAFWVDSLRAREHALSAGRSACQRYGLQFLDDTVACSRLRVSRDAHGRVRLARTYTFEFSDTGNNRRRGAIHMLGPVVQDLQMEPYPLA